jgi:hypothetical protein
MVSKQVKVLDFVAKRNFYIDIVGAIKFEVKISNCGVVIEKHISFSREDAANWISNRILLGGFDFLTIEAVQETAIGNA